MALAFGLPRKPGQNTVNHKVGKLNHIDNLEWASQAEQIQHSYATHDRKSSAPRRSKPVRGRKVGTEAWTAYESASGAAAQLQLSRGNISKACRKGWKVGGYEFEFDAPNEPEILPDEVWRDVCLQ